MHFHKRLSSLLAMLLLFSGTTSAGQVRRASRHEEVRVWPGQAPGTEDWKGSEETADVTLPNVGKIRVITNVTVPTLTVFRPVRGKANGTAMVVLPDSTTSVNSDHIVALAARHRLPAVYSFKYIVRAGGLMSYGIVAADHYRQAALYVDKILRGAKPADLPVQVPVKYETALNVRTAKAFGLTPPAGLMVAADEVIE